MVHAVSITFIAKTGVMAIEGSAGNDSAEVRVEAGWVKAVLTSSDGSSADKLIPVTRVSSIKFVGKDGNDSFIDNTDIQSFADGGGDDDVLIGGSANDELVGAAAMIGSKAEPAMTSSAAVTAATPCGVATATT